LPLDCDFYLAVGSLPLSRPTENPYLRDPGVRDSELRRCWLPDLELTERTARPERSIRFDGADGPGEPAFAATGAGTAQVAVEQAALPDGGRACQARLATSAGRSQGMVGG
jgi:hypothetical protein